MNNISTTYISSVVIILVSILQAFKINIGSEELTPILEGFITGIGGLYIIWKKWKNGEITALGVRK